MGALAYNTISGYLCWPRVVHVMAFTESRQPKRVHKQHITIWKILSYLVRRKRARNYSYSILSSISNSVLSELTASTNQKKNKPIQWFVMLHYETQSFKEWIVAENVKRIGEGRNAVEPFFPSDFLRGEDTAGSKTVASDSNRSMASALSRFVFIKGGEEDVDELVNEETRLRFHLTYYRNTNGKKAVVPSRMMQDFFEACLKYRGFFEIVSPIQGIEGGDRVKIKSGPFAGQEATVVRVQHSKGEVHLELAMEMVNGVMSIWMSNVDRSQVTILGRDAVDAIRTDFIEYTQTHLLDILEHRVKGVEDEEVKRQDVAMLTRLFRYRNHEVENRSAQMHFLALMLICAHLCRYSTEEKSLTEKVQDSLAEINKKSESKAATDTRAYLHVALYIATRNPIYRESAKQYVRDHQPKSNRLRRFVWLIRTGKKI